MGDKFHIRVTGAAGRVGDEGYSYRTAVLSKASVWVYVCGAEQTRRPCAHGCGGLVPVTVAILNLMHRAIAGSRDDALRHTVSADPGGDGQCGGGGGKTLRRESFIMLMTLKMKHDPKPP